MEKLTQYRSIARFVKKAIDLSLPKERSTFPSQKIDRSLYPHSYTHVSLQNLI
ncbi:hypothetical protein QUB12_08935 [Microcoleus sp. B7-D4]